MSEFLMKNWKSRARKALGKGRRLLWKSWMVKSMDPELEREIWLLRLDLDVLKRMMRDSFLIPKLPAPIRRLIKA